MSTTTFNRRLEQLIQQVKDHPQREEILRLAYEQIMDDADTVTKCND